MSNEMTTDEIIKQMELDVEYEKGRTDKCPVCSCRTAEGEMTCGDKSCRMEFWGITPDEIYEDLWYGETE